MKKILCTLFGHNPINKILSFECNDHKNHKDDWTSYTATCKICNCNLFGKEFIGEYSKEKMTVWIKLDSYPTNQVQP